MTGSTEPIAAHPSDFPTRQPAVSGLLHVGAALWVLGMLAIARQAPGRYYDLVQEDHFIEWWTVGLFALAGIAMLRRAWSSRAIFDAMVGLFCLFVAGEEFSWGQRLVGFTPPTFFLEHNTQQELTLHNFADLFGRPKGVLITALLGYGAVLPILSRLRSGAGLLRRIGASAPPFGLTPWFVTSASLLVLYPTNFTSEWVEALAGALFLASAVHRRVVPALSVAAALTALLLTWVSDRPWRSSPATLACAEGEVHALLHDIAGGNAALPRLTRVRSVHKRLHSAIDDGYIDGSRLESFATATCAQEDSGVVARRREAGVDPWGLAYWVRIERVRDSTRITVYSMGPNRRRNPGVTDGTRADISARTWVRHVAPAPPAVGLTDEPSP